MNRHLNRVVAICLTGVGLAVGVAGCSLLDSDKAEQEPLVERGVTLTYQTSGARLATQGAELSAGTSSTPSALTLATMQIKYPHPEGTPGAAQALLVLHPLDGEGKFNSRVFQERMETLSNASTAAPGGPLQTWTLDIPQWQLEAVVARLEDTAFFRSRATYLNPEAFLAVRLGDQGVGKKYRSLPGVGRHDRRGPQQGPAIPSDTGGRIPIDRPILARLPAISENR